MSAETQYYTIVESEEHLDHINSVLSEKGVSYFVRYDEIARAIKKTPMAIYYYRDFRRGCQYSSLEYAERFRYTRKDIKMISLPEELFVM